MAKRNLSRIQNVRQASCTARILASSFFCLNYERQWHNKLTQRKKSNHKKRLQKKLFPGKLNVSSETMK